MKNLNYPKMKQHLDDAVVLRFPCPNSSVVVTSGVLGAFSHFIVSIDFSTGLYFSQTNSGAVLALPCCRIRRAYREFDNNKNDLVQVGGLEDL
ncbi:hypothetical protein PsorP6_015430 [Peronosclerospora sorghi]|uniref:Uncharacterized protein n=1 Tax=Peronosclerospora sorghi TaxID=230839 RepID=A0ACC0WQ11_9STRA|nr:hypothetical protein PsorP6_015430 [Peronosclerospora sorghi]